MKKNLILFVLIFIGMITAAQGLKLPSKFSFKYSFKEPRQKVFLRVSYYPAYSGGEYFGADYVEFLEAVVVKGNSVGFVPLKGLDVSGEAKTVKTNLVKGKKYLIGVEMKDEERDTFIKIGTLDMAGTFFLFINGEEVYPPAIMEEVTVQKSIDVDVQRPVNGNVMVGREYSDLPKEMAYPVSDAAGRTLESVDPDLPEEARFDPTLNTNEPLVTAKKLAGKKTVSLPLNLNNWNAVHFNPHLNSNPATFRTEYSPAFFTCVKSGLKVNATTYRMGAWLIQRSQIDYSGKEVLLKWKLNAQSDFSDVHAIIYTGDEKKEPFMDHLKMLSYLSTRNEWDNSVLIPFTDSWFYTRLVFSKNSCTSYTATGNYDHKGGKLIQTFTKPVPVTTGRIGLGFGDVYSGNAAYFILGEAVIQAK